MPPDDVEPGQPHPPVSLPPGKRMGMDEAFSVNVKDVGFLGRFPSDYRLPHTDMAGTPLNVGDLVSCHYTNGSWLDGRVGLVLKLGCVSPAGESDGHLLQMEGCVSVAKWFCVKLKEAGYGFAKRG